jgi:NAD(P)-dependent dehydrogenase (short-subunit alcohol dehydrogenase family)
MIMERTVLITGNDTPLSKALIETLINDGCQVIATIEPSKMDKKLEKQKNPRCLPWSSRSPLSARNVILEGTGGTEKIDEAIFISAAGYENRPLHELPSATIEEYIDFSLKGSLFMFREILSHFQKRGEGTLSFILHSDGTELLPPIDSVITGAFRELMSTLFTFYQNEPVRLFGFESSLPEASEFARFIMGILKAGNKQSSGKWYRYSEKGTLFSGLKGRKR